MSTYVEESDGTGKINDIPDNISVVSDSGISEKASSVKSSASGIPKLASKIKPPSAPSGPPSVSGSSNSTSRIGRLCLGQQKPALPSATPTKNNSTILTEDTDSFIIGQRVWVGGTKPGSIAYIGETLFAPGEWAGIVLDQPIGKNDGSVGGTRYFQCEPKKGVFSRLTRLTRYPLNDADVVDATTSTPLNGSRRSPISPTGSASPIKSPLSFTMSNTSLSSAHIDYKLGDRVIIKSSQGSKIGVLRFMGSTDFAAGEWCGVELDEPRGKNDGSVGGKRYFDCRPHFGLFAPIAKVSKSPSNRKPVACIVHSGPGIPPSGFRRANSKESLASNTSITSAASGVRREVLKEKQQHIEQLLKERDLERAEIAKAASQADEAEQKFATLKQEYEFYRNDTEKKLQEHLSLLTQLTNHRSELLTAIEDEKRKNEDLQFRFEEAAITKADLENKNTDLSVTIEDNTNRIAQLENQLTSERQRIEVLEGDSNKLFEAEEHLVRIKEENEALKYEIEVAAQKIQSLETEGVSNKDLATLHQKDLEELQLVIKQKDDTIEKIKTDIKSISDQYEQSRINFTKEIDEQKAKYNTANTESAELKSKLEIIFTELNQTKMQCDEQAVTLERTIASAKETEVKLNKEIDKLKMNLSAKVLDIETNNDLIDKKTEEIKQLKLDLDSFKNNFASQNSDLNKFRENAKEIEDNLRKELEESKSTVKLKVDEMEQIKTSLTKIITEKEDELKKANEMIKNHTENINQLNASIIHLKEVNTRNTEEAQSIFSKKLKELDLKLADSTTIINEKEDALKKSNSEISKLEDLLKQKNEESNELFSKNNEETTQLRLNIGDLERKLKSSDERATELMDQKLKLENEVQALIGSSGDFSNKLNDMSKELQEKDKNIESIKDNFKNKLQDLERSKDEIQLRYNQYIQKSEKELVDRDQIINNLTVDKDAIKEELDKNCIENKNLVADLNNRINELQTSLENKENLLKKTQYDINEIQENSKVTVEKIQSEYNSKNEDLQKRLENALKENTEVNEVLSKKSSEILEVQGKYNEQVELSKKSGDELKLSFEEKVQNLEKQLAEKEQEQLNQIEIGKHQLDEKTKEIEHQKDDLRKEMEEKLSAMEKCKNQYVEENKVLLLQLENLNQNFAKSEAENTKIIGEFKNEINNLQNAVSDRDLCMQKMQEEYKLKETQLNDQLSKYSGDLQSNLKEFQTQIDNLNKEKSELINNVTEKTQEITLLEKKYIEVVENYKRDENVSITKFEEEKKQMLEQINILNQKINDNSVETEKLKDIKTNQELSSGEKDKEISQLKSELQLNHQFVNKLQLEKKELLQQKENLQQSDQEKGKLCTELNNTISQLSKEMQVVKESSCNVQIANNLYTTILQLLQLSEIEKINLVDRMEAAKKNEIDTESYTKLCKVVDSINVYEDNSKEEKIYELEKEIEAHKKKQQELENKLKRQETQIPRYKNESKPQDGNKVVNNETKLDNSNKSSLINNNPITNEQLMEDKLLAESQVAFLNSIIVDMQKKNEDQKARIEILESGYSPAAADELRLLRLTDRQLPPRMYCDICEEFDLHETEDCPQQANEDLPARGRSPKEKPAQRPYCEICEVFGHATEDCQEDQTF